MKDRDFLMWNKKDLGGDEMKIIDLKPIIQNETPWIHIPNFFPLSEISKIVDRILERELKSKNESSVYRSMHVPLFEAATDNTKLAALVSSGLKREADIDVDFSPMHQDLRTYGEV